MRPRRTHLGLLLLVAAIFLLPLLQSCAAATVRAEPVPVQAIEDEDGEESPEAEEPTNEGEGGSA